MLPGIRYTESYAADLAHGAITNNITEDNGVTDVLSTAHLGLLALELGDVKKAKASAEYLQGAIEFQPSRTDFYLRFNAAGLPIQDYDAKKSPLYCFSSLLPDQLYFMIGYPPAFLLKLYEAVPEPRHLECAQRYIDFGLQTEFVMSSVFSHKFAWAISLLAKHIPDEKYITAIERIVDHFVGLQGENGMWFGDDPLTAFDQTAEIICWLTEISCALEYVEAHQQEKIKGAFSAAP